MADLLDDFLRWIVLIKKEKACVNNGLKIKYNPESCYVGELRARSANN